ncbi:MAG TPA: ATP-binding protein, partial [Steroidobacteraceae bacterium]|nr:ATP-binding protein [Steroidobacteraceae bacterium]
TLTGDDFLPLVVRLDDLFGHLKSVRELVDRVDGLRANSSLSAPSAPASLSAAALDKLAQRIAAEHGKQVRLVTAGLDDVPAAFGKPLRDVLIQLVRNAVVHGIEPVEARRAAGKDPAGLLHVQFRPGADGFELLVQDDGAGVDADRVRAAAVERGLLGAEQARGLDVKGVYALLFRPGFSTRDAQDRDAGRGVGLDLVRRTVQELGGKVGVATAAGKFTRFRILLGPEPACQDAVA